MKRRRYLVMLAAAICMTATSSHAADPGFIDCLKAEKADEKAICAEPRLIQDDAQMTTLYRVASSFIGMGARGALQDAQVAWLDERHACKADLACLKTTYSSRIERLQKVIDGVAARGPF